MSDGSTGMAWFGKYKVFLLFKVLLLLGLFWLLLNYYSGILEKEHFSAPFRGMRHKTVEIPRHMGAWNKPDPNTNVNLKCEPNSINVPVGKGAKVVMCKRAVPSRESCFSIEKFFGTLKTSVDSCLQEQEQYKICEITELSIGDYRVNCEQNLCKGSLYLGVTNERNGELEWTRFSTASNLEDNIAQIIHPGFQKKHFGFCFIRCEPLESVDSTVNYDDYQDDDFDSSLITQLLVLPPQIFAQPGNKYFSEENLPFDINLILLDSVSRHHFYRSLPKVLETFEYINRQPKLKAKVFDFKLFQTIKARTFESINALFAGIVDTEVKPFGIYDKPYRPLSYETLLKPLKKNGYRTLFLEDLCWTWEWGIPKDLLVLNKSSSASHTWERLIKAFDAAGIDETDISLSSCEILKANGKKDPFHQLPKICFNGRNMNEYFLEYLSAYQRKLSLARENFLTYYANDDSHEEYGTRLKSLDEPFAKYVKDILQNQNMLTVIFSDHGNSYGPFVENTYEGRLELYHASLFIIIPNGLQHKLGPEKLAALATNQNRLISILDLHYTLKSLIPNYESSVDVEHRKYLLNPDGLFSVISPNRTCNDMPHLNPHLCICQGDEMPALNNSAHAIFAEFALGSLNNIIQNQYKEAHPKARSGFGSCQRLVAGSFTNILTSTDQDGSVIIRLDLRIDFTQPDVGKSEEVFFCVVRYTLGQKESMKLVSFKRMTKYGHFEQCADKGVLLHLCVCSLPMNKISIPHSLFESKFMTLDVLQTETEAYPLDEDSCLVLLIRQYSVGASFEARNDCKNRRYRMVLMFTVTNMDSSNGFPIDIMIDRGGHTFLTVLSQRARNKDWNWRYSVKYGYQGV